MGGFFVVVVVGLFFLVGAPLVDSGDGPLDMSGGMNSGAAPRV